MNNRNKEANIRLQKQQHEKKRHSSSWKQKCFVCKRNDFLLSNGLCKSCEIKRLNNEILVGVNIKSKR